MHALTQHPGPALRAQRGVSLIEVLICIVIFMVLFAIGMPQYRTWLESVEVRNGAESVLNAAQHARAEAIRRNRPVELVLTDIPFTSWTVQSGAPAVAIETHSAADGATRARVIMEAGGTHIIRFNSMGRVAAGTQFELRFEGESGIPDVRKLKVRIEPSGDARMCDPQLDPSHVQGCPA